MLIWAKQVQAYLKHMRVPTARPQRGRGGGAAPRLLLPLEPYRTEELSFKLMPATFKNVIPVNMGAELTAPANAEGDWFYWAAVSLTWTGTASQILNVTSVSIASGAEVPAQPNGTDGQPSGVYITLGTIYTDEESITAFEPYHLSSLDLVPYVTFVSANQISRAITWVPTGPMMEE